MLDSSHGGSYGTHEGMMPLDKQYQFFGTLNFPVTEETDAWKEKVNYANFVISSCLAVILVAYMIGF